MSYQKIDKMTETHWSGPKTKNSRHERSAELRLDLVVNYKLAYLATNRQENYPTETERKLDNQQAGDNLLKGVNYWQATSARDVISGKY